MAHSKCVKDRGMTAKESQQKMENIPRLTRKRGYQQQQSETQGMEGRAES